MGRFEGGSGQDHRGGRLERCENSFCWGRGGDVVERRKKIKASNVSASRRRLLPSFFLRSPAKQSCGPESIKGLLVTKTKKTLVLPGLSEREN